MKAKIEPQNIRIALDLSMFEAQVLMKVMANVNGGEALLCHNLFDALEEAGIECNLSSDVGLITLSNPTDITDTSNNE